MVAGRYTLEREIGRGGMGAVWLARDEVLARHVAIKRIGMAPGSMDADLLRAEREGRLAAMLNHPNVVAVFDLIDDGDEHWLVMEYVESVNLAALVRRDGPLPPDAAAPIVQQAAEALEAAHAAGIVHRDVKPSNILVTAHGQAKLTDFGIARGLADASLTRTGLVTGSPAYLAPEVASGGSATAQSDVWGLGATLFHALSGRPPYEVGDNLMGAMYRIVHEEPPRLAEAGWLAPLLEGAMTRDPRERWTMADVRGFLTSHGGATPPAMVTPTVPAGGEVTPPEADPTRVATSVPWARPTPRSPRLSASTVLAGLLAIALVVILGGLWLGQDRTPSADPPGATTSPEPTDAPTEEPGGPDEAGMAQFVRDYVATAADDPRRGFEMLTPGFQEASGGLAGYRSFWNRVRSATVREVEADLDDLTVEYEVDYVFNNGTRDSDDVELQLVYDEGRYLIAGED